MVNARLEEKGLLCRIDHRSYVDQGLDLIPTVHEGPHVRKMEKKGIRTEKGGVEPLDQSYQSYDSQYASYHCGAERMD